MLKTRVISGVVGLVLLGIVVFSGRIVLAVGVFLLSVVGIFEFYNAVSNVGYKPIRFIGYISCIPIILLGINNGNKGLIDYLTLIKSANYLYLGLFLSMIVLMYFIIFLHERHNIIDISLTVFGVFYVEFLFSFIVQTRNLNNGFYYLWFIFIGAFATDTFAYFAGRLFGKTKLLPEISPKKTLEGAIGGIIGCILLTCLYGLFLNAFFPRNGTETIDFYHFIILGAINGVISQVGDWAASSVKRFSRIKDYGNIMPGHGGVLDRFDSILFVAPTVYLYISLIVFS